VASKRKSPKARSRKSSARKTPKKSARKTPKKSARKTPKKSAKTPKKSAKTPKKSARKTSGSKRPVNAFMKYMKKHRQEYAVKHPGTKASEVAKAMGAQWRALSEAEKEHYKSM
jgi:hypothetical protein